DSLDLAGFFAGCGRALVWPGEIQWRWPARRTPTNILGRLTGNYLKVEERSNRAGVDAIEHLLKQVEALLLIFNQRIFLTVADQADALLEVIEREEVVFPLRVDNVEHDDAFISAHRFRPNLLFLVRIVDLEFFPDRIRHFRGSKFWNIYTFGIRVEIVNGFYLQFVVFDVPIVG